MNLHDLLADKLPAGELSRISSLSQAQEIEKGGGTRRFFRVCRDNDVPAIVCLYDDSKAENFLYAGIANFMRKIGVPAPEIFFHDAQRRVLVMEDFGEVDLWTLRAENSPATNAAYRSALAEIAKLHRDGLKNLGATEIMRDGFNADYYKWERDYFLVNAAKKAHKICISGAANADLANELAALATMLLAQPPQLVHRDFQSQNILWHDNRARFIDFQGMRVGTGWYDVASLLFDPYVNIGDNERAELLAFYCDEMEIPPQTRNNAEKIFYCAAAQRLMQAIGAYFFLSAERNKPRFRKFALPALENLKIAASRSGRLPFLNMLATELASRERRRLALGL